MILVLTTLLKVVYQLGSFCILSGLYSSITYSYKILVIDKIGKGKRRGKAALIKEPAKNGQYMENAMNMIEHV